MNDQLPILSVSQATNAIKACLENSFPNLWIKGEVSNCKLQSSGHLYFSLKDAKAQIAAVMFRNEAASLKFPLKDGDHIMVHGELNVYPPSGKYQLIIKELKQMGLGELLLQLEERKAKLLKKGYFSAQHKKPLPKFPRRIGVVTSPTGAVIQDIIHILSRRFNGFHLILYPVKVQGEGAAQEIAQAIEHFNHYEMVDVMIVGRGGGSLEDLWAFNEEIVADAIFKSQIPIISAVGHETDHCIADYVADVRAPTPSAAAEIVVAEKSQLLGHLLQSRKRLDQHISLAVKQYRHYLNGLLKHPLFISPHAILRPSMQRLDDFKEELDAGIKRFFLNKHALLDARNRQLQSLKPLAKIVHLRQMLDQKRERLRQSMLARLQGYKKLFNGEQKRGQLDQNWQRLVNLKRERLGKVAAALHSIDPKNLLAKGYSILFAEKEGHVITSIDQIRCNENLTILVSDGSIIANVKEVVK